MVISVPLRIEVDHVNCTVCGCPLKHTVRLQLEQQSCTISTRVAMPVVCRILSESISKYKIYMYPLGVHHTDK